MSSPDGSTSTPPASDSTAPMTNSSSSSGSSSSSSPSNIHTGNTSWKLPLGIEDHLEDGVYKTLLGATVGGAVALLCFKSGQGWRAASLATGVGVAVGSTVTRIYGRPPTGDTGRAAAAAPSTTTIADTDPVATTATSPCSTVRVQKFQTEMPPHGHA